MSRPTVYRSVDNQIIPVDTTTSCLGSIDSGRTDACRDATALWLAEHVGVPFELFMRKAGDVRKDSVVKLELFDRHIRHRYRVLYVLDDRAQVVQAWRSIGLTVFQVAEGDF